MIIQKDCPDCFTGVISPHEQAQGHNQCGNCRAREIRDVMQNKTIDNKSRARRR